MSKIKLSDYAKENGVCYRTAWNRFNAGKIPHATKSNTGTIEIELVKKQKPVFNVVYTRVSTSEQRKDLETQTDRLVQFANSRGLQVHKVIKEVASGLNDQRPKLQEILEDEKVTLIIVENKDRLTRFGFNYLTTLLKFKDCEILVMNEIQDNKEDLIQDFISIITSFCARIYSRRRSKNQVEKIIKELEKDEC
jgi:putative resolvase